MIDSTQPMNPINGTASSQDMRARTSPQEKHDAAPAAESKSSVTLSSLTKQIQTDDQRDIDVDRVAKMRAALEAGELPLAPKEIAQALVQDMFDFN